MYAVLSVASSASSSCCMQHHLIINNSNETTTELACCCNELVANCIFSFRFGIFQVKFFLNNSIISTIKQYAISNHNLTLKASIFVLQAPHLSYTRTCIIVRVAIRQKFFIVSDLTLNCFIISVFLYNCLLLIHFVFSKFITFHVVSMNLRYCTWKLLFCVFYLVIEVDINKKYPIESTRLKYIYKLYNWWVIFL